LVNPSALEKLPAPFSVAFKSQPPQPDPNAGLYKITRPDPLTIQFEHSDGHLASSKSFSFGQKSYLSKVASKLTLDGAAQSHSLAWRGGFGDSTVVNPAANE